MASKRIVVGKDGKDDLIHGQGGNDVLLGLGGNDQLFGEAGDDLLVGGAGNDRLAGGRGSDILDGGAGNDLLDGGAGNDSMSGGSGDDTYIVDRSGDSVSETLSLAKGGGIDTVLSSISYKLGAHLDNLTLTGAADVNGTGNGLANVIIGNDGHNTLKGGGGDDSLTGGSGDTLRGEAGNDTLVLLTTDITKADGGDGIDTVNLAAITGDVDLTGILGAAIKNIDIIDLGDSGPGTNLILNETALNAVIGEEGGLGGYQLVVKGDAADSVTLDAGWLLARVINQPFDIPGSYRQYEKDGTVLYIDSDIATKGGSDLSFATLDGTNGFRIDGAGYHPFRSDDRWLANAGDLNGDGFDDLLLGGSGIFPQTGASVVLGHEGAFAPVLNVGTMTAADGIRIQGPTGKAVAAGDINGDGFADLVISSASGASVIFGHAGGFGADFSAPLDGINGFRIAATGSAATADVNGDGFDDIILGAPQTDFAGPASGSAYVVYGHAGGFDPGINLDIDTLYSGKAARFDGVGSIQAGYQVADAGDVNGDGYGDFMVASLVSTTVVYGRGEPYWPIFSLLAGFDGTNGFTLAGGHSVSSAGDINGDGIDDLIVGDSGQVVFGHKGGGVIGFSILQDGAIVSTAGDVNGDGYADFLVGHPLPQTGQTYVVFGRGDDFGAELDLDTLTPSQGFRLNGLSPGDTSGAAISAAGDLNGDGYGDLVIGSPNASPNGQSYVIFGKDFTGAVHAGTVGTSADEAFVGTAKDDVIHGNGGKDAFSTGAGNDEIHVTDGNFLHINGGTGIDTLHLDFAGAIDFNDLDFNVLDSDSGAIEGIDIISTDNGVDNALVLHLADVLAIGAENRDVGGNPDLDNVLRFDGDAGDNLQLFAADGWSAADNAALTGYAVYSHGGVQIAVESTIAVTVS
jgi:hypothetical protein